MHEAQLHEENQFLTLTYDDDHLPDDHGLDQSHMQKFWKRLRKAYPENKIRYVYAGEYGGKTARPHYHAIAFGLDLPDLRHKEDNHRGEKLYTSESLDQIWGKGFSVVGEVTSHSCAYVASYMLKDTKTGLWKDEYTYLNEFTGEFHQRMKPFARHSNRPGIGRDWYETFKDDVFPDDFVVCKVGNKYRRMPTPKYYLNLLEKHNPALHEQIKSRRQDYTKSVRAWRESKPERLAAKEKNRVAKMSLGTRGTGADGVPVRAKVNAVIPYIPGDSRAEQLRQHQHAKINSLINGS